MADAAELAAAAAVLPTEVDGAGMEEDQPHTNGVAQGAVPGEDGDVEADDASEAARREERVVVSAGHGWNA